MKNRPSKMNKDLFTAIKILLQSGNTIEETANHLKIGTSTVTRVKRCESLTEYHNIMAAMYAKKKEKEAVKPAPAPEPEKISLEVEEAPKKAPVGPENTALSKYYSDNRVWDALKQQNELLTLISNKLTALLECWGA